MAMMLPDRFKKKKLGPSMPPPGMDDGKKPAAIVAIGIGKKPGDDDTGTDPGDEQPDDIPAPKAASHQGAPPADDDADGDVDAMEGDADGGNGLASDDDAIVLRAGDKTCQSCKNWTPEDGTCAKVDGSPFDPDDRCLRYYEKMEGGAPQPDDGASSIETQATGGVPA